MAHGKGRTRPFVASDRAYLRVTLFSFHLINLAIAFFLLSFDGLQDLLRGDGKVSDPHTDRIENRIPERGVGRQRSTFRHFLCSEGPIRVYAFNKDMLAS